jgi:hypothetical protein
MSARAWPEENTAAATNTNERNPLFRMVNLDMSVPPFRRYVSGLSAGSSLQTDRG